MKIRIIAWTDRGEIDVTREWDYEETSGFGFMAHRTERVALRDALDLIAAQVASAYEGADQ